MSRRLQTYTEGALEVTYDPTVCAHAAACVRRAPAVFDPRERRWVRLEKGDDADIIAAVLACPTGALQVKVDGVAVSRDGDAGAATADPQAADAVEIRMSANGPLLVRGAIRVLAADGTVIQTTDKAALCRCGQSQNKPFCDGSHHAAKFRSE